MDVKIVRCAAALPTLLSEGHYRVFSCLNGYTLQVLVGQRAYDRLLAAEHTAFVLDGMLAVARMRALGLKAERVCGRDLLAAALASLDRPLVVVGGVRPGDAAVQAAIARFVGREFQMLTPPMFGAASDLAAYADAVAPSIPRGALVATFIRSPLQDLLSGELAARTDGSVFINVGAVIDDIVRGRTDEIRGFSRFGLEWLYRLVADPRRTWPKVVTSIRGSFDLRRSGYRWQLA